LVVPVFNEEAVLPLLFARLDGVLARLDGPAEVVIVDDGSRDRSAALVEARIARDDRYRLVALSRNFGQQLAITAGLDSARGDAIVILDCDLQDPPELILDLVAKWKEGFEVVCAQRRSRPGDGRFKILTARLFYGVMGRLARVDIPANVGDFRLIDRKVADAVRRLPERERFVRGLFSWVGFKHALVPFERPARAAGSTKYSIWKLARLAVNALISFSEAPLRFALWSGIGVSILAFLYGCYVIVQRLANPDSLPGWSSTIVVVAFLGGANMLMTGIMGLYVGRIYTEVKGRPLYVLDRKRGFETAEAPAATDARALIASLEAQLAAALGRKVS
jgi:dolichol-phosphate mannosyltransferase